jgi:hypothetical protein
LEEGESALPCVCKRGTGEAVTLVGVEVALACELLEFAEFLQLLRARNRDIPVEFAVQDEERRHCFELVEEAIGKTAVPVRDGLDGQILRASRESNGRPEREADESDLSWAVAWKRPLGGDEIRDRIYPGLIVGVGWSLARGNVEVVRKQNVVAVGGEELGFGPIGWNGRAAGSVQEDDGGRRRWFAVLLVVHCVLLSLEGLGLLSYGGLGWGLSLHRQRE